MARYTGSKCKICRREKVKLFLKGGKCYLNCVLESRSSKFVRHGKRRTRVSEFGKRLREKQKMRMYYGILEKQFKRYFDLTSRRKGPKSETLIKILESRFDNILYKLGFADSRAFARQLIIHKHIQLNSKVATIPSMLLKPQDIITVKEKSRKMNSVIRSIERARERQTPEWLDIDYDGFTGRLVRLPEVNELDIPIQPQLIVEFYSR